MKKRISAAYLAVCFFLITFFFALPTSALADGGELIHEFSLPAPFLDDANAVCFYNTNIERTVFSKNADKVIFPASTVKVMSGLLFCEYFESTLDSEFTVTEEMLNGASGNSLHLMAGERVTPRSMIYAAICGGYNDACLALAVYSEGSVSAFVTKMNERARKMGAVSTTYKNPTGLHDPSMVTTARDTMLICLEASKNPLFAKISNAKSYTFPANDLSPERNIHTRNYLISEFITAEYYNPYCEGMNSGFTDEGGYCLATTVKYKGASYICVVMGAETLNDDSDGVIPSYGVVNRIVDWAKNSFKVVPALKKGDEVTVEDVIGGNKLRQKVTLICKEDLNLLIPANASVENDIVIDYHITKGALKAPFDEGHDAGYLSVAYKGVPFTTSRLVTSGSAQEGGISLVLSSIGKYTRSRAFIATCVCFAVLFPLSFPFRRRRKKRLIRKT